MILMKLKYKFLTIIGMSESENNSCSSTNVNFNFLLDICGESYEDQLKVYRAGQNEALLKFKRNYSEILSCDSDNANSVKCKAPFNNRYSFKPTNENSQLEDQKLNLNTLYDRCFYLNPKVKRKEIWQKKVTVPEPFNLTCYNNKTKIDKVELNEAPQTSENPHHPKPVPASVYLPLYGLMQKHNEKDRKERLEERQKKLLATVKPFNLSASSESRQRSLSCSLTDLRSSLNAIFNENMKVKPFPKHLFDLKKKHTAEVTEELRKIRIRARAEEMLKQSSLPFSGDKITRKWNSMSSLGLVKKKEKEENEKKGQENRYFFLIRPKSNIPKHSTHLTQPKDDTKKENQPVEVVGEKIENPQHSGFKSILDYDRLCQRSQRVVNKKQPTSKDLSKPSSVIQKKVIMKVRLNEHLLNHTDLKAKLKENRKNDQRRMEEYALEIEEMKERVRQRPLLIERQTMESLRKTAQKRLAQEGPKFYTKINQDSSSRKSVSSDNNSKVSSRGEDTEHSMESGITSESQET